MKVPALCSVYQSVEWRTSGSESFILYAGGRGNLADHQFKRGKLLWTGAGSSGSKDAGIADISFENLTFAHWEGANETKEPATFESLRARVRRASLPEAECDQIAGEIWSVIEQYRAGKPSATAPTGRVIPVSDGPENGADVICGFVLWLAAIIGVFQITGRIGLPRAAPAAG